MKFLEQTLRSIVLCGVFALPVVALIVANELFFPYITGKNFAFRIIVEIITGAWLALALVVPKWRPRRSWILASFALFIFIMALADALGAYPFKSFWSNYERMDGFITIAHTFVYLVVLTAVMQSENLWRRLFQWSLVVSVFLSVLGLLQVAGVLALGSGGTGLTGRVDATFGNPIYFAAYMLFHVFIGILLWYQMWQVRGKGNRLTPSIFYGFVIALDTVALLLTGTRGTMLGLIGGAFLTLVLLSIVPEARRLRQVTAIALVALIIGGGVLWSVRESAFIQRIAFLNRLASISLTDNTTKARFFNMGMAWQGVKERPLLGWGQENYAVVFDKYYDPRMYGQEQWFDRVHNIIFDWWVAGGFLGLLAYISIFVAALWALWRPSVERGSTEASMLNVRRSPSGVATFTHPERSILTGLLAAYTVHNMTVFDNVTSYILFGTILGYIAYREAVAQSAHSIFEKEFLPRGALSIVAALAALVVWGAAWSINTHAFAENEKILAALQQRSGGPAQNLALFKEAISYGTYGDQEAREQLAQVAAQIAGADVPADLKAQFRETAVHELDLQAAQSPLDARFPLFAAMVLGAHGDYAAAATKLERAHELSPKKQTILFELAQNAGLRGDVNASLQYFKTAFELEPEYLNARIYYASALIRAGKDADADAVLAPIIPTGEAADTHITGAYVARKQFGKLIPIWQARIAVSPSDAQAYFTLAAAYFESGDTAHAIATLEKAGSLDPAVKEQADKYILDIRSGVLKPGQ
ncbi:MAG TPA: O-antigen ligase family protein [Candidatus Paceibacterota bacterium]